MSTVCYDDLIFYMMRWQKYARQFLLQKTYHTWVQKEDERTCHAKTQEEQLNVRTVMRKNYIAYDTAWFKSPTDLEVVKHVDDPCGLYGL